MERLTLSPGRAVRCPEPSCTLHFRPRARLARELNLKKDETGDTRVRNVDRTLHVLPRNTLPLVFGSCALTSLKMSY